MLPYLLLIVLAALVARKVIYASSFGTRNSNEPYIGKIFAPFAGPLHTGNERPNVTIYETEPFLAYNTPNPRVLSDRRPFRR
jgi:hypothetical protein